MSVRGGKQCCFNCKHMDFDDEMETDWGRCGFPLPFWVTPARVLSDDGFNCPTYEEKINDRDRE